MKKILREEGSTGSTCAGTIAVISAPLMSTCDLIRRTEENTQTTKYTNSPNPTIYKDRGNHSVKR